MSASNGARLCLGRIELLHRQAYQPYLLDAKDLLERLGVRIQNLEQQQRNGVTRISFEQEWEDSDRQPRSVFFETLGEDDPIWADPNAILQASYLSAWRNGERRITLEGSICPMLVRGLQVVTTMMKFWYDEFPDQAPTVEPSNGFEAGSPSKGQALSLLSCGLDSTATLYWNLMNIPPTHPDSIRTAVVVAQSTEPANAANKVERIAGGRLEAARRMVEGTGVTAVPMITNLVELDRGRFFTDKSHGAVFAAVASLFSHRFSRGYLASSHTAPLVKEWGSTPIADPHFSTAHFNFSHDGFGWSRLDKLAMISDWDQGFANLRVCQNDDAGSKNCGTCEKCIRTMLHLIILGKLEQCRAFPRDDVDVALVRTLDDHDMINQHGFLPFYHELIERLAACGRTDLSRALEDVLRKAAKKRSPPRAIVADGSAP